MKNNHNSIVYLIRRSLEILPRNDQIKIIGITFAQFALSILDLFGIAVLGILGSVAISGVSWRGNNVKIQDFLNYAGLAGLNLRDQVLLLGIIGSITIFFKSIVSLYFNRRILYYLSYRSAKLSSKLLKNLLNADLQTIQQRSVQDLIYSSTTGVQSVMVGILGVAMTLVSDLILLVILLIGLMITDFATALLALFIFSLVAMLLFGGLKNRTSNLQESLTESIIRTNDKTSEVIHAFREISVHGRQTYFAEAIGNLRIKGANSSAELTFLGFLNKYVIEFTLIFGTLIIIAFQFSTQSSTHAIAVLSIFIVSASRIAPAILRIQQGLLSIKGNSVAAKPTFQLMKELSLIPNRVAKGSENPDLIYKDFIPEIIMNQIQFNFNSKHNFQVKVDKLEIKPGQVVALVGSSGAGKTTLVDLILGLLNPTKGQITISGFKPAEAISKWPGAISYVPQQVYMVNGTLRENITLGYPPESFTNIQIIDALNTSQLSELLAASDSGLDRLIGERGAKISGGQSQRIGIARALLTKPKFLILDEATSSLDSETEKNLTNAIKKLRGKSTILVIAHRLSTVKEADIVLYMENGKIIAKGSFDEVRGLVPNFDRQAQLMGL